MRFFKRRGSPYWQFSHTVKVKGKGKIRLRESTGQTDRDLAKEVAQSRVQDETQRILHGLRRKYLFSEGAAKYLQDKKDSGKDVSDDLNHLDPLMPYIGNVVMSELYSDHPKLAQFRKDRKAAGLKNNTVNRSLEKVRLILNLAANEWREDGLTWIASAPTIKLLPRDDETGGYPLTWGQQRQFFSLLPPHLRRMALFAVNTGLREAWVCGLKWEWERHIPGVGTVFDLPTSKNGRPYRVPLNRIAREIVEECRGVHPVYVFTYRGTSCPMPGYEPLSKRVAAMNNTAWDRARDKAGLRDVRGPGEHFRVHDLRHTFATRLREAGVSREDRKDLLGHVNDDITTHYSTAETARLMECVERLVNMDERPSIYVVAHKYDTQEKEAPEGLASA